jgi:hypothetical protein
LLTLALETAVTFLVIIDIQILMLFGTLLKFFSVGVCITKCSGKIKVTGEWRKLHNEELHNLYSAPNVIRQIKSRLFRWAGHVERMGEESVQGFGGKPP